MSINSAEPVVDVCTLGNSDGKTVVMKTGSLVTTAITANQVVLTYTVTAAKTLYLSYLNIHAFLTSAFTTGVAIGEASIESPGGTKLNTFKFIASTVEPLLAHTLTLSEPVPFAAGVVLRIVCTPISTSSMTWTANFGGYER